MSVEIASPLLKIENLSVDFHTEAGIVHAAQNVSFTVNRGETVALVGESGSGKSVTALSILQLLPYPAASHPRGSILLKDQELVGGSLSVLRSVRGNRISMIFQEPMTSLNPLHSIGKQVSETLLIHKGLSKESSRQRTLGLGYRFETPDDESTASLSSPLRHRSHVLRLSARAFLIRNLCP